MSEDVLLAKCIIRQAIDDAIDSENDIVCIALDDAIDSENDIVCIALDDAIEVERILQQEEGQDD